MQVELDIEDVIEDAVREAVDKVDLLADVDVSDMVQDRINDMDTDLILEGVDVRDIVNDILEDIDFLEDIDLDALATARIKNLIDDVEFHSYKSLREEFLGSQEWQSNTTGTLSRVGGVMDLHSQDILTLKDVVKAQANSLREMYAIIQVLKAKVDKPWYKFW